MLIHLINKFRTPSPARAVLIQQTARAADVKTLNMSPVKRNRCCERSRCSSRRGPKQGQSLPPENKVSRRYQLWAVSGKMSVDLPGRWGSGVPGRRQRPHFSWSKLGIEHGVKYREPRCKIEMGLLITRGLLGSAQELVPDPEELGELLQGLRKLTQQNEQPSCALKAHRTVRLESTLGVRLAW